MATCLFIATAFPPDDAVHFEAAAEEVTI